MIESGIEHAHYIFTFVIDNLARLFVPQHRYRVFPLIVFVGFEIYLTQELRMEEVIDCTTGVLIISRWEAPATIIFWVGFDNAHGKELLEAF